MHSDSDDVSLSLSAKAYLIANSLQITTKRLFLLLILLFGYISFAILIGFFLNDVSFYKFWLPYTLIVFSPLVIWFFSRARRFYNLFNSWKKIYFEQSYFVIFNTTLPKGNNTAEKIFNLSKNIFPEIRDDYWRYFVDYQDSLKYFFRNRLFKYKRDKDLSKVLNYKDKSFLIDVLLKTDKDYFIIKVFDKKVTIDTMKEFMKAITENLGNIYKKNKVFRSMIVAKDFDNIFLNRNTLEELMQDELKTPFPLDLIMEEEVGYSVLWIGR